MNDDINEIEKAAANLSIEQRAQLVRRLIASLDSGEDQDAEQFWLDEVERRLNDYRAGKTAARVAEEIFFQVEQKSISAGSGRGVY